MNNTPRLSKTGIEYADYEAEIARLQEQNKNLKQEMLRQVLGLIDKYIGNGQYEVEVEFSGKMCSIRGTSADLGQVWGKMRKELTELYPDG